MRFLATADVHIGLRPGRLAAEHAERYAASRAWRACVDEALRRRVDAVLLAGDVVDAANRFFEAMGPLERELARLVEAGIEVIAVAGNHDCDVLRQVAAELKSPRFHLLGEGGQWERRILADRAGEKVQIVGWSFRDRSVYRSPLHSFSRELLEPDLPVLGLLHGDMDNAQSRYAPLAAHDFAMTGVPLWVLGHVHKPGPPHAELPHIFYAGSPQGLDPGIGERGPHGPWLIEWADGGWQIEHLPLAPVRYEAIRISLDGLERLDQVRPEVRRQLGEELDAFCREQPAMEILVARLTCEGRTTLLHQDIAAELAEMRESGHTVREVQLVVDRLQIATRPPLDLAALAESGGIVGELALLIQLLEGDQALPEAQRELLDQVAAATNGMMARPVFEPLGEEAVGALRPLLARQAWRLLEALLPGENAHG